MIIDYNLKAVIFDDKIEEAQPIIDALNYERIPNVFINFKDDLRDDKPLKNIRIVFADLILGGESEGAAEKVLESIRTSIIDNIQVSNGPFILVVWSKHSTRAEELEKRIREISNLNFVTIPLDKNDYFERKNGEYRLKESNSLDNLRYSIQNSIDQLDEFEYLNQSKTGFRKASSYNDLLDDIKNDILKKVNDIFEITEESWQLKDGITFAQISADILKKLANIEYLNIFLEWESDARDTISKVLNSLLENIANENNVKKVVSSAIKSTLGQKVNSDSKDMLNAFYHTLNSILADSIENKSLSESKHDTFLKSLDLDDIDSEMKAIINYKTLFEETHDKTIKNGNIYCIKDLEDVIPKDILKNIFGLDIENILNSDFIVHLPQQKLDDRNIAIDKYCNTLETAIDELSGKLLGNKAFSKKCKDNIKSLIYPIVMEFTPSCDIANNKFNKSRLIFGLLFEPSVKCIAKKSDSLYLTDFHFKLKNEDKSLDSNYRLAFFIKNIFAINPALLKEICPLIRARKELVNDLQHSISNHISRIGISSIDGF